MSENILSCYMNSKNVTPPLLLRTVADPEGLSGFARTPLHALRFLISYENEIIWSQCDQIISFSWDI